MNKTSLEKIWASVALTEAEKTFVLDYFYGLGSEFIKSLYRTISLADKNNLAKLMHPYPYHVAAYLRWIEGDLKELVESITGENIE